MAVRNFVLGKDVLLFRRTKALEMEIDDCLDKLSESALLFRRAIDIYLSEGASEAYAEIFREVDLFVAPSRYLLERFRRLSAKYRFCRPEDECR